MKEARDDPSLETWKSPKQEGGHSWNTKGQKESPLCFIHWWTWEVKSRLPMKVLQWRSWSQWVMCRLKQSPEIWCPKCLTVRIVRVTRVRLQRHWATLTFRWKQWHKRLVSNIVSETGTGHEQHWENTGKCSEHRDQETRKGYFFWR